jgi:hypothetical protein
MQAERHCGVSDGGGRQPLHREPNLSLGQLLDGRDHTTRKVSKQDENDGVAQDPRKHGHVSKGPFPRTYQSVVQPAVQGSVRPVTYTFEVNLSCTAGSTTRSKTERVVPI